MSAAENKRKKILNAARRQFSQYGFRKTSMEDIAREASISRASIYSYFDNKEEIFRNLSQWLNSEAFAAAENSLTDNRGTLSIADRIQQAVLAFNVSLYRLLDESPHGAELMDESNRLAGDIAQNFYGSFQELLAKEIDFAVKEGELNLKKSKVKSVEAAEVIRLAIVGLKAGTPNADVFQKRVEQFIRVYFAGLES